MNEPTTRSGRTLVSEGGTGSQNNTYGSLLQAVLAIEVEKDKEYERVVDRYRQQRDEAADSVDLHWTDDR